MKNNLYALIARGCLFLFITLMWIQYAGAQNLNPSEWPNLKGYWTFQKAGNLTKASVGKDLKLVGSHKFVSGPAWGDTAVRVTIGNYYICDHQIAPNGGGDSVNRYTLMFDFRILSFKKWHTFFQTDSLNTNDGECFIRPLGGTKPGRIGVAATGYSNDSINPNQWYRMVVSVNNGHFYRYYINGKLFHEGDTQDIDERFALTPKLLLFADENQEDDTIDIASVAVFDTCLTAAQIQKLGTIEPCIANPPTVSLGRDTVLCVGQTYLKWAAYTGMPAKFQWSTGAPYGYTNLTYKNPGMGQKKVWVKMTDVNGCVASDTMQVTFNPTPPKPNIGPDQTFCKGDSVATLVLGTDTSYKYEWYNYSKNWISHKGPVFITDTMAYYIGFVIHSLGCRNSDTIQINAFKKPARPTIGVNTPPGNIICQGQVLAMWGPTSVGYLWSNGIKQKTNYADKPGDFTLQVFDGNCYSEPSDTLHVKVNPLPPKPVMNITGNFNICSSDSVELKATPGYVAYKWNMIQTKQNSYWIKAPGQFAVSVKDSNGCESPYSDYAIGSMVTRPGQPDVVNVGTSSICQGSQTVLRASILANFYEWSDGNKTFFDTIKLAGNYKVRIADVANCFSEWSYPRNIVVNPVPSKPAINVVASNSLSCTTNHQQYKWFRNGVEINTTQKTIYVNGSGYYSLRVGNNNCWSELSDSVYMKDLGVNTINSKNQVQVYPNPFDNKFTLKSTLLLNGPVAIVITDQTGKTIYTQSIEQFSGEYTIHDAGNWAKGVYMVQLRFKDLNITTRMIKL